MFWPDPTHQPYQPPTHPPNHTPTHGWGILHRFQIFKQNWNILISSSVIEFLLILGVYPPGGVTDGCMGVGVGMGVWGGISCTHTCTHMHALMHMHVKHANHTKHGCLHVGGHLQFLYMYTCVYVHVRACTCMCVCGGTSPHAPRCPWHPPSHLPPPQNRREPKTAKFNKSWTNRDNSILFKDSLPLNIPELI